MLYLAEDEKQVFIDKMKRQTLEGKTSVKYPVFTALIGAQGSGKSHLAERVENSVLISSDYIIGEFIKTVNIDPRENFYDSELGRFASRVNNEILKEAINHRYNVIYDTSFLEETKKMVDFMAQYGYQVEMKVMLADEYQAAMNVAERKLDFDERYTRYSRERLDGASYPEGNPLPVMPAVSDNTSAVVMDFIKRAVRSNTPIEIYEFGKNEPSFKTGDDFDKFVENLELIPMEEHIKRCKKLQRRADEAGNEDYFMQLKMLQNAMMKDR